MPSDGRVTITPAATLILSPNTSRRSFWIRNSGSKKVYIGIDSSVDTTHPVLMPFGSFDRVTLSDYKGAVYGICASCGIILCIIFGFITSAYADVTGGVNNPFPLIEEVDGTPSSVYWRWEVPDGSMTEHSDGSLGLDWATVAHSVASYWRLDMVNSPPTAAVDIGAQDFDTTGAISDGVATLSNGNLTGMGNITGADVDLSLGTGDTTTSGTITTDNGVYTVTIGGATYAIQIATTGATPYGICTADDGGGQAYLIYTLNTMGYFFNTPYVAALGNTGGVGGTSAIYGTDGTRYFWACDGTYAVKATGNAYVSGDVGIGIAPTTNLHVAHATLNEQAEFYHETYSTGGADYSRIRLRKSNSNTLGTLAETDNTDILGSIYFSGVNSSSGWSGGARIYAVQTDASGATYIPGYMALGGSSATTGTWSTLYLSDDDKVGIRVADPTVALDVLGDGLFTGAVTITSTLGAGAITGTSLTDGSLTIDDGAITALVSISDGTATWSGSDLAGFGSISGTTLTDTVLSINSGSLTSAVNGTFSGTIQAEHLYSTDDVIIDGSLVVDTPTLVVNADSYLNRVGIGTATPQNTLVVKSPSLSLVNWQPLSLISSSAQGAGVGAGIMFGGRYITSAENVSGFGSMACRKENAISNNVAGYFEFGTRPAGGSVRAVMTLDSLGNMLMNVGGDITTTGTIANNATNSQHTFGANGAADSYIQYDGTDLDLLSDNEITLTTGTQLETNGDFSMGGDLLFVGASSGHPYGCIDGIDETVATVINDWVQVTFDNVGEENLMTGSAADEDIVVGVTGIYDVDVVICGHTAVAHDFEFLVKINNGTVDKAPHLFQSTAVANQVENTAGSFKISLTAEDTVELWVLCSDANGINFIFDHVSLSLTMVGG